MCYAYYVLRILAFITTVLLLCCLDFGPVRPLGLVLHRNKSTTKNEPNNFKACWS